MVMRNINVHTYGRSPTTGKEKLVDMKMAVDMAVDAVTDSFNSIHSEYIIVTGDADLYPAVEKVKQFGYRVHVWSWSTSISNAYVPEVDDKAESELAFITWTNSERSSNTSKSVSHIHRVNMDLGADFNSAVDTYTRKPT
jgi:hypothetical protein